jgi:ADP-dependent NAD(P)H-hydrate dehydratase
MTIVDAAFLRTMPLPEPGGGGKEERGRVLVVAGSREVPGAALLAGTAALRVGAGKLQFHTAASIAVPLAFAMPEAMVVGLPETEAGSPGPEAADRIAEAARRCSAVLVGPGLVNDDATAELVGLLLARVEGCPLVLDAAAMMRLPEHRDALRSRQGCAIVTPHAGEMAGLLGIDKDEVEADPPAIARRVADTFGVIVILKGACTFIATPDGQDVTCDHGNAGLGTSGSGDTLAGLLVGLLGRGASPFQAACWGVFLHGEAGHRLAAAHGPLGFLAREIPGEIPKILADLATGRDADGP